MSEVVRIDPQYGAWEAIGEGAYRGIVAEVSEAKSNGWGPETMSFTLKLQPGAVRPDLMPFTPVEYEVDGLLCWAGFVRERPSGERELSVQCNGWQFHLDDDQYSRAYVHTRISDFQDVRQNLATQLGTTEYAAAGQTSIGDVGGAMLGFPKDTALVAGERCGILLDLGVDSKAKRVVLNWSSSSNTGYVTLYCRGLASGPFGSTETGEDAFSIVNNVGTSGTTAGTFTVSRRYVCFFLYVSAGPLTLTTDVWMRLNSIQLFRDTAYESANASILKADTVIKDARAIAPLLNQANDLITAGTFAIPEYVTDGYTMPRAAMEAVNVYENYRLKIGGPDLRTLVYGVKPTAPLFEVGAGAGSELADASLAGDEIYDQVIVEGTGPDGSPVISRRSQTGTLVDRRSFHRATTLPIRSAITQAVADRFGDLFLTEHKTAPFSAKLTLAGGGVKRLQGGASVPPHEMLLHAGEKLRLAHRLDPDTGGWGRDGRIAGVTYRPADRSVEIDLDDRRDSFEEILSRYGLLVDQFR